MDAAGSWTGREATALRLALRMTKDSFAAALRIAPRTVAYWAANPEIMPRPAIQLALDQLLASAPADVRGRVQAIVSGQDAKPAGQAQLLRVAITVVLRGPHALLVMRRETDSGISWQFPAGIVKPGEQPAAVAIRETLAETGVHAIVRRPLGSRLHPVTSVHCDYFACDYLLGDAANQDPRENATVAWVPRQDVTRCVARNMIYPPVMEILEGHLEPAAIR